VNLKTCSIVVGNGSLIYDNVYFERDYASLKIGENSFTGGSDFIISTNVTIGNDVLIAYGCIIRDHNSHSLDAVVRQKDLRALLEGRPKDWASVDCSPIVIEDNAWVGARAIIVKGVRIGHNSAVGIGAVVTKDVSAFTIVGGNPARQIGMTLEK